MNQYVRWIIFGVVALGIVILLIFAGSNKKLRQQLTALLLEKKIKTEIDIIKDKAIIIKNKADNNKIAAEEAEQLSKNNDATIAEKKQLLQKQFENNGMTADEITNRFKHLGV